MEIQGVLEFFQGMVEAGGVEMEILNGGAVSVIVEQLSNFAELNHIIRGKAERGADISGRIVEIVSECSAYSPFTEPALEKGVDDEGGAAVRRRVDAGREMGGFRDGAGVMMVNVEDFVAGL